MNDTLLVFIYTFILGGIFGSFLYCVSYRYVNKISILELRSKCDYCGHQLAILDLIPIVSFIASKGKCRYCNHKLDRLYLISEIISGFAFVMVYIKYGLSLDFVMYSILTCIMMVISFVDLKIQIIPDSLIIIGLINLFLFHKNLINCLINGLLISFFIFLLRLIMNKVLKKESMGFGDIKLFFMLGCYLSMYLNFVCTIIACLIGMVFSFIFKKEEIPFGPSMCLAYFLTIIIYL